MKLTPCSVAPVNFAFVRSMREKFAKVRVWPLKFLPTAADGEVGQASGAATTTASGATRFCASAGSETPTIAARHAEPRSTCLKKRITASSRRC